MTITRFLALRACVAAALSMIPAAAFAQDGSARTPSLKELFKDAFTVGTALAPRQFLGEDAASVARFSEQLESNVLAPYALTQACLPLLFEARGQIVFVNSSAGKSASPGVGQFSATQHAMRAFADTLRGEVNDRGVRITVVHPGRTATPRQASIHEFEGRAYNPGLLMQPRDVAETVLAVVTLPGTAEITEVVMRPMRKS